jgi:hypothetical protein
MERCLLIRLSQRRLGAAYSSILAFRALPGNREDSSTSSPKKGIGRTTGKTLYRAQGSRGIGVFSPFFRDPRRRRGSGCHRPGNTGTPPDSRKALQENQLWPAFGPARRPRSPAPLAGPARRPRSPAPLAGPRLPVLPGPILPGFHSPVKNPFHVVP